MLLQIGKRRLDETRKRNLITYTDPESLISEQYRTIRTNIHFLREDNKSNILLVTSPGKHEGKTTTVTNIAISMAQQGEKVLVIDGNLRSPEIHYIFNVSNEIGLTDILLGKVTFEGAVTKSGIDSLDILTSGLIPFNPAELLGSQKMQHLMNKIKPLYDFIIIDSSSLLEVTDTKIIANLCSGVVLVVKKNKTTREYTLRSKKELEYAKAQVVGVILNEMT